MDSPWAVATAAAWVEMAVQAAASLGARRGVAVEEVAREAVREAATLAAAARAMVAPQEVAPLAGWLAKTGSARSRCDKQSTSSGGQ